MTDEERNHLNEIMARAAARWRWGDIVDEPTPTIRRTIGRWIRHDVEMIAAALAAAEAAGFVIVPPDDGR